MRCYVVALCCSWLCWRGQLLSGGWVSACRCAAVPVLAAPALLCSPSALCAHTHSPLTPTPPPLSPVSASPTMLSRLIVGGVARQARAAMLAQRAAALTAPRRSHATAAAAVSVPKKGAAVFAAHDVFEPRHLGPSGQADQAAMLKVIGMKTLDQLIDATVPAAIRTKSDTANDSEDSGSGRGTGHDAQPMQRHPASSMDGEPVACV